MLLWWVAREGRQWGSYLGLPLETPNARTKEAKHVKREEHKPCEWGRVLSLGSKRERRWASSKASWSSAWTVLEAKLQICLLCLGKLRPALGHCGPGPGQAHRPLACLTVGNKASDLSIYNPSLSSKHILNFKCVRSPSPITAFENVSSLQSFILMKRTGFREKILSIKLPFFPALYWSTQIENVHKDLFNFIHCS